jgi:hypothetical protein
MARKLCAFVIEGKEGSLIGARGFVCPLGHSAYQTETGSDVRFRRTIARLGISRRPARIGLTRISARLITFPAKLRFAVNA